MGELHSPDGVFFSFAAPGLLAHSCLNSSNPVATRPLGKRHDEAGTRQTPGRQSGRVTVGVSNAPGATFILEALGIEKRFGATPVLRSTNLRVQPGEIHALLGGNGAGKSTLIRIISGVLRADAGTVRVAGSESFAATDIAVVFQELALLPHLTVAENICLPHRKRGVGLYRRSEAEREAGAALAMIDAQLSTDVLERTVGALDLHQRQLVEIARALSSGARLLLLDEPTANLTFAESERLFTVLRRLARQQGISTILVSHRMAEIRAVADVCTILRDGRTVVDRQDLASFSDAAIVAAMGQSKGSQVAPARADRGDGRAVVLSLAHRRQRADLVRGDVLGLAGAPEGPMDLINGLTGAAPSQAWTITLDGQALRLRRPAEAVRLGIGYVSGDRAEKGILASLPILDNIVAGTRVARRRVLALGGELRQADAALQRLSIKASSVDALPQTLSGGTQQKLLLARWLETAPRILVLEEPTRGVDIGTKRDIYALIRQVADSGTIVIWWSTEFSELAEICDLALAFDLAGEPSRLLARAELSEHQLAQATGIAA
jgi:ribose transport system ATP-binding protein